MIGGLVLVGYTRAQESEKANVLPVSKTLAPTAARFAAWEPGQPPYIALAMQLFRAETIEMEQFALNIGIQPGEIGTASVDQSALAPYKTKQSVGKITMFCSPTLLADNNQKCNLVMGGEIAVPVATEKSVAGEVPSKIRTELFGLKFECQPTVSADCKSVMLALTATEQTIKDSYKSVQTMPDLIQRVVDVPNLHLIEIQTVVKAKVGEPVAIRLDTIGPIEVTNLHGEHVDVTTIIVVTPVLVAEVPTEDKK